MNVYTGNVWGYPLVLLVACGLATGCAARSAPPARVESEQEAADGGLTVPPASKKKGIIVPSDVGLGAQPPATSPGPGTNDNGGLGSSMGPAPSQN